MEVGAATRPKLGEVECGDQYIILRDDEKRTTLIALADGLGHGSKAAEAARAAIEYVETNRDMDLEVLMEGCNKAISHTRGAALSLLRIDEAKSELCFVGVGNVELRARTSQGRNNVVNSPGIVGHRMRRVREYGFGLIPGNLFLLHSDGISSRVDLGSYDSMPCGEMAQDILSRHGKEHDDATCVVIRY